VILRADQDLRELAEIWYGNPDAWPEIRKFNGMDSSTAPVGSVVFIPTQRAP
jgi:hypothetical protein